jgi:hypothetical protein
MAPHTKGAGLSLFLVNGTITFESSACWEPRLARYSATDEQAMKFDLSYAQSAL